MARVAVAGVKILVQGRNKPGQIENISDLPNHEP
jgi:hypothetical protein